MMIAVAALSVLIAGVHGAQYGYVAPNLDLSANSRWVGGVNPLNTQVSATTFGTAGQFTAGFIPSGSTARTGNIITLSGNVAIALGGTPTQPSVISLASPPSGSLNVQQTAATVAVNTSNPRDPYRPAMDYNCPLNWAVGYDAALQANIHPIVAPTASDNLLFSVNSATQIQAAVSFGQPTLANSLGLMTSIATLGAPVTGPNMYANGGIPVTQCTAALVSGSGSQFGSTIVSMSSCGLGTTPSPSAFSDAAAAAANACGSYRQWSSAGNTYRIYASYNGPAALGGYDGVGGGCGHEWIYMQNSDGTLTGPLTNAQHPTIPQHGGTGGAPIQCGDPASGDPASVSCRISSTDGACHCSDGSFDGTDGDGTRHRATGPCPSTGSSANKGPLDPSTGSGIGLLILIIVVLLGVVGFVYIKVARRTLTEEQMLEKSKKAAGVGFENPLYDQQYNEDNDFSSVSGGMGDVSEGEYMDLPAAGDSLDIDEDPAGVIYDDGSSGYMDVSANATSGYMDVDENATGGYMDVDGEVQYDDF